MDKNDLLLFSHRLTDRRLFRPFHSLARRLYLGPLHSHIKSKMLSVFGKDSLDLIPRHSAVSGIGFNLFSSDLDCTLVMSRPFTLDYIDEVREHYYRLKRQFPMLGEIEIFSESEWRTLQELLREYGPILSLLRDLKKIRWMEMKLELPTHLYHSNKARRSILRVIDKYEPSLQRTEQISKTKNHRLLGAGFSRYFETLVSVEEALKSIQSQRPESFSLHSREINASIGSSASLDPALLLDADIALCLLSLFPSHEDDDASILRLLLILRQTPQIRPLHTAVLRHDLIYANASPRVHIQFRDTSWQWTESLIRQLQAHAPDSDFKATMNALNYHRSDGNGFGASA